MKSRLIEQCSRKEVFIIILEKKKHTYKAFGLSIWSEIILPELTEIELVSTDDVDVRIECGELEHEAQEWHIAERNFQYQNEALLFEIPDLSLFQVMGGERIIVSPYQGVSMARVRLYLLGTCMGAILMQRRTLPLHGSAVLIDGFAYAFLGDSGAGKSTLSAALANNGYPLLSDDVVAVHYTKESAGPIVSPAYPQQKLNALSMDMLHMESKGYEIIMDEFKYAVPRREKFHVHEVPLAGVFELLPTTENKISVEPIYALSGIHLLQAHTYRLALIKRMKMLQWHFSSVTQLAGVIPMKRISRPLNGRTVNDLVETVLETVNKGVSTSI
ncbi:aldolase [Paenibacillus sp. Marseille-Q4541]|uniref:aldolase n=1 Tax=Paenibacillus sp. Marseille-Q4541 TaxID=2831522 RepID=UPI001BA74F10|nr:aldolase [Paenibacillus sp. Marseille-Q4541]